MFILTFRADWGTNSKFEDKWHTLFFNHIYISELCDNGDWYIMRTECVRCEYQIVHKFDGKRWYNCSDDPYPILKGQSIVPLLCEDCFKEKWGLK